MQAAPWDAGVYKHALALYDRYKPTPEVDGQQAIGFGWLLGNVAYSTGARSTAASPWNDGGLGAAPFQAGLTTLVPVGASS